MGTVLELGCGGNPHHNATIHHDRTAHSPWVDIAWDLNVLMWPWGDDSCDRVIAHDVLEHLDLDIADWLDELWRIVRPGGSVDLRLPAWDNPLSWRDPTHRRVFHHETLDYWDPSRGLWHGFGRIYFGDRWPGCPDQWWRIDSVRRFDDAPNGDLCWEMSPLKSLRGDPDGDDRALAAALANMMRSNDE